MRRIHAALTYGLVVVTSLSLVPHARALPIELKDQNGTRYSVNTAVDPLVNSSNASGALTNATYLKPVTVTSYFVTFTPWFGFATWTTVQRQVDVPLRNAFAGFNGLLVTSLNGTRLPTPLVYNPGQALASQDCSNRQLNFQTQTFADVGLQLARRVYVPGNAEWVRWVNLVTNTGAAPVTVGVTLKGLIGSGSDTRVLATSSGDSNLGAGDAWFTTGLSVSKGSLNTQPTIGYLVQGPGASAPAVNVGINGNGQAAFTYTPTIQPGQTAVIASYVTVQGNNKQAKNTISNIDVSSKTLNCLPERDLAAVVNFRKPTPPVTKNATIKLNFKKTGQDTVEWHGKITIGAGIALQGQPVSVDVGGAAASFVLNKKGKADNGGGNKFSLAAELKNGVTKAGTYKFSFNLKGDFQATLADYGLVDASLGKTPVSVPILFTAGPGEYGAAQALTYKATAGKSGTAKTGS